MKFDRITVDPARMNGQPCVRNMRLTVRRIVELAAFYPDREELRHRNIPSLRMRTFSRLCSMPPHISMTALWISP